jgi:ribosomal silencing factor RsfS
MFERFIEQKAAIDIVALDEKNIENELKTLTVATMIALERMLTVLKPVKQFTKKVGCKNHAT